MKLPEIGQSASQSLTITDDHVRKFAELSGDFNPIHIDDEYAAKTRFKKRISHGVLTMSLISRVAGMHLPGPGSIYLSQTIKFKNPVYIGDTVTATVTVKNIRKDKPLITLGTVCHNQNGELLMEGDALVFYEPVED